MWNMLTLSAVAGAVFGVIFIWQGAADAFLVLLFAAVGLLIGFTFLLVRRVLEGEIDGGDVSSFFGDVVNGSRR